MMLQKFCAVKHNVSFHLDLCIITQSWEVNQRFLHDHNTMSVINCASSATNRAPRNMRQVTELMSSSLVLLPTLEFVLLHTLTQFLNHTFSHHPLHLKLELQREQLAQPSHISCFVLSTNVAFKTIVPFSLIMGILCPSGNWMNELSP